MTQIEEILAQIEGNSIALTQKFQAATEAALDECVKQDDEGNVTGFTFQGGRSQQLFNVASAYQSFAAAEAARRSSSRPLPAPQIHLTRPKQEQTATPAAGTEPAGMEPLTYDGP